MPLEKELATYQREKQRLLAESAGKYVLIKDDKVIDTFMNQEDALNAGYRNFGNTEFLVKQVSVMEEFGNFTRALV